MDPRQTPSPLDYLNQISAPPPKKAGLSGLPLNFRLVILVGIGLVLAVVIAIIVTNAISAARKESWQDFAVKLPATGKIADEAGKYIKNSQLRSLNSDLKLYVTNTTRDMAGPLKTAGVDPAKLPESIVEKEAAGGATARLEIGRLNAKYDSTYAREMSYQLASLLTILQKLYASSGNQANRTFLKAAYDNLLPTYKAMAVFSASNE